MVFAYNTVEQDSTGFSPFYLLHGFHARMVMDVVDPNIDVPNTQRFEVLHEGRELAIRANRLAQGTQKRHYDRNRRLQEFEVGDLVLIHRARGYIGQTTKLRHPYEGPFRVLQKNSDLVYLVQNLNTRLRRPREELVHVTRMKPYHEREIPPNSRNLGSRSDTTADNADVTGPVNNTASVNDEGTNATTSAVTSHRNRPLGTVSWLRTFTHYALLVCLILQCATARVVWRKTPFRVNKGIQEVVFAVHYLLPCQNGTTVYNEKRSARKLNVTARFMEWCETYTKQIVQTKLNTFCSDGGTSMESSPRSILNREQTWSRLERIRARNSNSFLDYGDGLGQVVRPATKLRRRKRWILAAFMGIVAVVSLIGNYFLSKAISQDSVSGVNDVVKVNIENTKKIAYELDEINRRVDDAFSQLNYTLVLIGGLKDQLDALEMEANVINQATVATIVSKYQILSHDLSDIIMEWHKGHIHPKFVDVFKLRDDCLKGSCPLDSYTPLSCTYDAVTQDITFRMKRVLVRDDLEIVNADAFTYYYLRQLYPPHNTTPAEFWKPQPTTLELCKSEYEGEKYLAITKKGCIKQISPSNPRATDIPIISEECLSFHSMTRGAQVYSNWTCSVENDHNFDRETVQLKVEDQHLLLYCPYQYYQLGEESKIICPTDSVITLPVHSNVTIWRHPLRSPTTPIVEYTYGSMSLSGVTDFDVPADMKFVIPEADTSWNKALHELKKKVNQSVVEAQHRDHLRLNLAQWVKQRHSTLVKIGFGLGLVAVVLVPIALTVFIIRKINHLPQVTPRPSRVDKPSPPDYTSSDEEEGHREPKIRFVDDRRY